MKTLEEKIIEIKKKYGVDPDADWIDGKVAIKILNEISELPEFAEDEDDSDNDN